MAKWRSTPEEWKPKGDGQFFVRAMDGYRQFKQRNHKSQVKVEEPVMQLLDELMIRHGVSGKRLESVLGLGVDRIKQMRRFSSAWTVMKIARQCFWLMGYDLQVRAVRVQQPDISVVITDREVYHKNLAKIQGTKETWDPRKMWSWLSMDKLPAIEHDEQKKID